MEPSMQQNKSSIGSIIGIIIIIAIIILGGLYFWGKRMEEARIKQNLVTENSGTETTDMNEAAVIKSINSSDDITSIQADLNNTKLDNLGAELDTQLQ